MPPAQPTVTPGELARSAAAGIAFTPSAVGAGPNRRANGLSIDTAVGYPVWLWAEGNRASLSDSASDGPLTVNLNASVSGITFDMGDGTTITCPSGGTPWTKGKTPGVESLDCGHRYERMGTYTITATTTWNVTWQGGGESGSLPMEASSTRTYIVGEVQALVR